MKCFQELKKLVYVSITLTTLSVTSGLLTAMEIINIFEGGIATLTFATLGIGIFPQRNAHIVQDYESRWEKLNEKLSAALDTLCSKDINCIHKRILDGVASYVKKDYESLIRSLVDVMHRTRECFH
jgi:hypothetical protein